MKKIILGALALLVPVALVWFSRVSDMTAMGIFFCLAAVEVISFENYQDTPEGGFWVALVSSSMLMIPALGIAQFFDDSPQLGAMLFFSGSYVCFLGAIICILRLIKNHWMTDAERKQTWRGFAIAGALTVCFVGAAFEELLGIVMPSEIFVVFIAVLAVEGTCFVANQILEMRTKKKSKDAKDQQVQMA